jgi:hypothetical protein
MLLLLLSFILFALVLALPTIPSIFEIRKPKDDGRLHITEQYVRDPRFFGTSFRSKLKPFVDEARSAGYGRAELQMRTEEDVRWSPDLQIPPDERLRGIGVGERVTVGHGAGIRDAYAIEHLDVEYDVVARTLTSNATMHIGNGVQVLRWIDADGDITVDADTDFGLSASGGARVQLGDRVTFERVWGAPVSSHTEMGTPFPLREPRARSSMPRPRATASPSSSTARRASLPARSSHRISRSTATSRSRTACTSPATSSRAAT